MRQTNEISVLKHIPYYYYKTWNYLRGNGLEEKGRVAHKKDYYKFIYELSQQLYHPEVIHLNYRRSLWGIGQHSLKEQVIRQDDIIKLPTLNCSLYMVARLIFNQYYRETDIFSKEQWEHVQKLACLIHHGVYTYCHETQKLDRKINYGEVRKLFTKHVDPTKLLIREKNKRISQTRIRPIHYKREEKWQKIKNKLKSEYKENPILLKRILSGIDLTLMDDDEGEDDRDNFYKDWVEPEINKTIINKHMGSLNIQDDEIEFDEESLENEHCVGYDLYLLIPPITKKEKYPTSTFFANRNDNFLELENYYNEKYDNLCIPSWDIYGCRLAVKYMCSVGISHDLNFFSKHHKGYKKNQIRILRVYKDNYQPVKTVYGLDYNQTYKK